MKVYLLNKNKMKTGIELITQERKDQIEKHKFDVSYDVRNNSLNKLTTGAIRLLEGSITHRDYPPEGWSNSMWTHMIDKSYKDRLIIAGALIAAEIDRIDNKNNMK